MLSVAEYTIFRLQWVVSSCVCRPSIMNHEILLWWETLNGTRDDAMTLYWTRNTNSRIICPLMALTLGYRGRQWHQWLGTRDPGHSSASGVCIAATQDGSRDNIRVCSRNTAEEARRLTVPRFLRYDKDPHVERNKARRVAIFNLDITEEGVLVLNFWSSGSWTILCDQVNDSNYDLGATPLRRASRTKRFMIVVLYGESPTTIILEILPSTQRPPKA